MHLLLGNATDNCIMMNDNFGEDPFIGFPVPLAQEAVGGVDIVIEYLARDHHRVEIVGFVYSGEPLISLRHSSSRSICSGSTSTLLAETTA